MGRNKPRHKFKQDGVRTNNYCTHCGMYNCDPMFWTPTPANLKRNHRSRNNECIGCGKPEGKCTCKNKKGY